MRCIIIYNVGGNPLYLDGPPKFSHWIWMKIGQGLLILVHILHQRIKKWPILAKAELEKFSKSTKKIFFLKACNFMRNCLIVCILLLHILFLRTRCLNFYKIILATKQAEKMRISQQSF